jgi:hypothetical protein
MVRGGINHDESGRVYRRKTWRQGHAQFGRGQGVAAKAAGARQTGYGLAHFEIGHAFAHGFNDAGIFRAWHEGQVGLHLVFVLNNQQVWKVQAGGFNPD